MVKGRSLEFGRLFTQKTLPKQPLCNAPRWEGALNVSNRKQGDIQAGGSMTDILLEKGVREYKESKACVYFLDNEDAFSQLGYKVMLSQKVPGLLKAVRLKHNGRTEFVYLTKGYQTFQTLLPALHRGSVFALCCKVVETILAIRNQGFLLSENIDVSVDRVYFDATTHKAFLVYLPLSAGEENSEMQFEAAARRLLLQLIKMADAVSSEKEKMVVNALLQGTEDFEIIGRMFREATGGNPTKSATGKLSLSSMDPNLQLKVTMEGDKLRIGRKKDNDFVLDFTNQISRLHCVIYQQADTFYVRDENSSFGTGLNGRRLLAGKPEEIRNGDVLILPGIKFKIQIA